MGITSWIGHISKENSILVDILLDAGAMYVVSRSPVLVLMFLICLVSIVVQMFPKALMVISCEIEVKE